MQNLPRFYFIRSAKNKIENKKREEPGHRTCLQICIYIYITLLLKNRYTILQGTLPIQLIKSLKDEADKADLASIDRLLTVCAALVNLGPSIVFKG